MILTVFENPFIEMYKTKTGQCTKTFSSRGKIRTYDGLSPTA